jgi:predicted metal-dependent peptidase
MAQDYVINYTLVEDRCGKMPDSGLYEKRFPDTMLSEEVYEILKKESVTIRMPLDEHLDLLQEDPKDDKDKDGNGSGDGQKYVDVTVMGKNGPPKLNEEDIAKIRAEIKASVIQAAQAAGAGNVPRGVARMIEDLINPKLDWRTLLDAHIRSSVKDDYTLQRMSRKTSALRYAAGEEQNARRDGTADEEHFEGEMALMEREEDDDASMSVPMLPTQDYMNTIDIMVAIDTSGSMTETMLRDMLSETAGIMTTFRDFRVRVCTFDTQVYGYTEYTGENIDQITEQPMQGGGGTMFECVWEYMKREGIEPHRLVVFTDGMPNSTWGDEGYVDTLFVIHTYTNIKAPWGITAYYEPNE